MRALEHKIPPPIVALTIAVAMWAVTGVAPAFPVATGLRAILALLIAVIGGAYAVGGAVSFRRARTTVNPLKPASASSLVTGGIYGATRNPMYVGLLMALVAMGIYLATIAALVGPLLFMLFIHRFQIVPEERALAEKFGPEYTEYAQRVRRWI